MVTNRGRRGVIAAVATVLWLAYMAVGLALIQHFVPNVNGNGPEGLVAFVGLVTGVIWAGIVMWAVSD